MATAIASAAPSVIIHPPASTFAELLRRSRFATFDPAIRQTYSSPPPDAHRGNWGLKRPIALRRRNAFISLTSFEHPAQFIEWNHAENQVRFIRRIEEMNTRPRTANHTPWDKSLGQAKTQWLMDSEFCPEEESEIMTKKEEREELRQNMTIGLEGMGMKGPGEYGMKRGEPAREEDEDGDAHAAQGTLNINAMSRRDFARHLQKLRELRPAFQAHIEERKKKDPLLAGKTLYSIAQDASTTHHRKFLKAHMTKELNNLDSLKFEPRPHPNAALMYSHPSPLDTHFTTKPQPGFILNTHTPSRSFRSVNQHPSYVASFGGMTALIKVSNAGGKTPLFNVNSEEGIDKTRLDNSVANLRPMPRGITLLVPPRVVGRKAQGLKAVSLNMDVTADMRGMEFGKDNPHEPGSHEYNAAPPRTQQSSPLFLKKRADSSLRWSSVNGAMARGGYNAIKNASAKGASDQLMSTLLNLTKKDKKDSGENM